LRERHREFSADTLTSAACSGEVLARRSPCNHVYVEGTKVIDNIVDAGDVQINDRMIKIESVGLAGRRPVFHCHGYLKACIFQA